MMVTLTGNTEHTSLWVRARGVTGSEMVPKSFLANHDSESRYT